MTIETILLSLIPSALIAVITIYFFNLHTKNEEKRRRYLLHREHQKQALPLRLQAYERMALFLERVSPGKLLLRTPPIAEDKKSYKSLLINTIEQEFEHNLTQQIYLSDECWNRIKAAKNGIITLIRKSSLQDSIKDADALREAILTEIVEKGSPSDIALTFIKNEVGELF